MANLYRITTQVVNAAGEPGEIVDIVEMESELSREEVSSYKLWQDYDADPVTMACPVCGKADMEQRGHGLECPKCGTIATEESPCKSN